MAISAACRLDHAWARPPTLIKPRRLQPYNVPQCRIPRGSLAGVTRSGCRVHCCGTDGTTHPDLPPEHSAAGRSHHTVPCTVLRRRLNLDLSTRRQFRAGYRRRDGRHGTARERGLASRRALQHGRTACQCNTVTRTDTRTQAEQRSQETGHLPEADQQPGVEKEPGAEQQPGAEEQPGA